MRADPLDLGAARVQKATQVGDMWLGGRETNGRVSLGRHRRHDEVLRRGDGRFGKHDIRAVQSLAVGVHRKRAVVFRFDFRAERAERKEMRVNGTVSDGASSRFTDRHLFRAREHRTE